MLSKVCSLFLPVVPAYIKSNFRVLSMGCLDVAIGKSVVDQRGNLRVRISHFIFVQISRNLGIQILWSWFLLCLFLFVLCLCMEVCVYISVCMHCGCCVCNDDQPQNSLYIKLKLYGYH